MHRFAVISAMKLRNGNEEDTCKYKHEVFAIIIAIYRLLVRLYHYSTNYKYCDYN